MFIPLRDNPGHIRALCELLQLGYASDAVTPVSGGFHHRVWRLVAEHGVFAVKQLAPDTDLSDPTVLRHYNATEEVAEQFAAQGIGAVYALRRGGDHLQLIDDSAYLVYPWTNALAIERGRISTDHALAVARLLARIHTADIDVAGLEKPLDNLVDGAKIEELVALATDRSPDATLYRHLPHFLDIARRQAQALPLLRARLVVSHGDLDQKNTLWDEHLRPVLIDWESARWVNPTCEALLEAMDWSGITGQFDRRLFQRFLLEYENAGGVIEQRFLEPALLAILGDWLDWLVYNVGREVMAVSADQRAGARAQIDLVLPIMLRVEQLLPELLSLAEGSVHGAALQA